VARLESTKGRRWLSLDIYAAQEILKRNKYDDT